MAGSEGFREGPGGAGPAGRACGARSEEAPRHDGSHVTRSSRPGPTVTAETDSDRAGQRRGILLCLVCVASRVCGDAALDRGGCGGARAAGPGERDGRDRAGWPNPSQCGAGVDGAQTGRRAAARMARGETLDA